MKKIVAVYTGQGLSGPLQAVFKEHLPDCEFNNIIDDTLIRDVVRAGRVIPAVARRLTQYFLIAQDMGADVIINTCSSVREVVDAAEPMMEVPIIRIDDAMGDEAVKNHNSICVMATLPTTLDPTVRMLQKKAADIGKEITIVSGLAQGAYDALVSGNPQEHDRMILETAARLANQADCFVLAQGSMGRMQQGLMEAAGKPVLASPPLCAAGVKAIKTPGMDMTSGSLGNGVSIGLGMALAARMQQIDNYIYVITGDGELEEGVIWEALNSAAKYKADRLIVFVDNNGMQSGGAVDKVGNMVNIPARFETFGWHWMAMIAPGFIMP